MLLNSSPHYPFPFCYPPMIAQARGTTLLNLRCEDIEGGLLGRQLLTLLSNKGYVGSGKGVVLPLLPPHKFTPHDVVALRPSKGAADGPPLVQGECTPNSSRRRGCGGG